MSSLPNFCRLCLQKFTGSFKNLNSDLKANIMVKNLFPGMNTDLVEKSKICNECFKYIQFSYTMRETVIKNEQKINLNMESIKEVEENTCRLCLNTRNLERTVLLYENVNQAMSFFEARSIIEIAIVTMGFEIFKKPVVCNCCWKIIKFIYLFKKKCFATEKILKFYCTKNNLVSLSNKDMESVSICYNSNLQKFSKGDNLNFLTNLVPSEYINNTSHRTLSSGDCIIRPVDVYLNNFTSEDEDDIFDEEVDDIFVESPKIIKEELSNTLTDVIKDEGGKQNTNLDQKSENLDEINQTAKEVKREEARNLNNTPKYIPEKDGQGVIVKNSVGKKVIKNHEVLQEKYITSAKTSEIVNNGNKKNNDEGDSEIMESMAESSEIQGNTSNISEETEIIAVESNKKIKNKSSENNNLRNFDSCLIETKIQNIEQSVQIDKKFEHNKKELKKYENLEENESRELDQNKDNLFDIQEETIKRITRKRKRSLEKSEDFIKASKNNSEENQKEILEPIAKKTKNKSENDESIQVSTKLGKIFKKRINNYEKISKKTPKLVSKEIKNETGWQCNQCEFTTKYKQHLRRHSLIHNNNGVIMKCSQCFYSTHIKRNLERHVLIHSSNNFIQCAHCTYSTVNKSHLKKHMLTHQQSNSTKDNVPDLKQYNTDSDNGQQKILSGFTCKECPFVTSKEAQIIAHLRTHKSLEKIFKCTQCNYITTRTHSLKDHMELHTEDSLKHKAFKCKLCSFTGKRRTHLLSHMLSHENEFKFNCSKCHYKAKRKSHLVTHMLRHQSGNKKFVYQCPHCKYKSIRKEHLKSHCRKMHPGKEEVDCRKAQVAIENDGSIKENKTATCLYCPYRYHTSKNLTVHIYTAHYPSESKEMQCHDCLYKSDKRRLFMKHVYNVHRSNGRKK